MQRERPRKQKTKNTRRKVWSAPTDDEICLLRSLRTNPRDILAVFVVMADHCPAYSQLGEDIYIFSSNPVVQYSNAGTTR